MNSSYRRRWKRVLHALVLELQNPKGIVGPRSRQHVMINLPIYIEFHLQEFFFALFLSLLGDRGGVYAQIYKGEPVCNRANCKRLVSDWSYLLPSLQRIKMTTMNSAGFLIYEGVMPLLKTYIAIFIGYTVARTGLFPPAASRSSSQLTMNVALPCLIFSNIVPAFTPSNISAIGPLMLLAVIYILVGFVSGLIIREVCFVPRNFWQGIIICTGMSNWGNLPTSVVQSVTAHAPFDGTTDVELGVSFVSIFIMVYHIFFWVFGAAASLQWDFLPDVPQGEEAMRPVKWNEKPIGGLVYRWCCQQPQEGRGRKTPELIENTKGLVVNKEKEGLNKRVSLGEKNGEENSSCPELLLEAGIARMQQQEESVDPDVQLARRVSRISAAAVPSRLPPLQCDSTSTPHPHSHNSSETTLPLARTLDNTKITSKWEHFFPAWFARTIKSMSVIITPVTIALAISLPVSVIQPLKALFTDATASGGPDWIGPDGSPPLNFIMDTATFIGALCVPLSLIILGASFARMSIPKRLSTLPIPAMILVTLSKEVMVPVIGIFLTQTFVAKGLIPKESLAQRFVAIFLSGTPTAVNQLVVATLYAPEGGMDTLTAFLVVQYTFMFISSTALTAIALLLL